VIARSEKYSAISQFQVLRRQAGYQGRASRLRQVSAVYTQSWLLPACARAPAKTVGAPRGAAYTLV